MRRENILWTVLVAVIVVLFGVGVFFLGRASRESAESARQGPPGFSLGPGGFGMIGGGTDYVYDFLEDLGFIPALEMLVRQADERTSAQVSLKKEGAARRQAAAVELAAYRIAQEALNNAVQHAQAENIIVYVRATSEGLLLSVVDDGMGFDLPSRPDVLTQAGHFGLMGMRERATLLGGSFRIDTAPGEGTRITVQLPAQAGETSPPGEPIPLLAA